MSAARRDQIMGVMLAITLIWAAVGCGFGYFAYSGGQRLNTTVEAELAFAQRPCRGLPCDRDEWAVLVPTNAGMRVLWPETDRQLVWPAPPIPDGLILDEYPVTPSSNWVSTADVRAVDLRVAFVRIDGKLFLGTLGQDDAVEVADRVHGVAWANDSGQLAVLRGLAAGEPGVLEIWDDAGEVVASFALPFTPRELARYDGNSSLSWSADDGLLLVFWGGGGVAERALVDVRAKTLSVVDWSGWFIGAEQVLTTWQENPPAAGEWPSSEPQYLRRGAVDGSELVLGDVLAGPLPEQWQLLDVAAGGVVLYEPSEHTLSFFDPRSYIALTTADLAEPEYVYVGYAVSFERYVLIPRSAVAGLIGAE